MRIAEIRQQFKGEFVLIAVATARQMVLETSGGFTAYQNLVYQLLRTL